MATAVNACTPTATAAHNACADTDMASPCEEKTKAETTKEGSTKKEEKKKEEKKSEKREKTETRVSAEKNLWKSDAQTLSSGVAAAVAPTCVAPLTPPQRGKDSMGSKGGDAAPRRHGGCLA